VPSIRWTERGGTGRYKSFGTLGAKAPEERMPTM